MSNIALKVFWSNEPMPLNRKIDRAAINVPFGVMITHPTGLIKSVNGKVGNVVLNAADVGADAAGSAEAVQQNLNTEFNALNIQLDSLSSQTTQVQALAQTNELKIGTKADQVDLETTNQQVEQNRLAILTKADISALAQLALLVDTKADQSYVNQQIANLVGSAPEALNTIYELAAAIQNDQSLIDSLNQSVANRVRFDIATQALTEIQKDNARTNIAAEKIGTAQQLVSQITATSIGAATAAQGAKADTALQSADVAPVALSGLFSSLGGQNKIFDVIFNNYVLGPNTAISAIDTLGQMLGKLQAQIDAQKVTWVKANTVGAVHPSIFVANDFIELARFNGMLWIRGFFKNTNHIIYESQPAFLRINDPAYKILQRISSTLIMFRITALSPANLSTTIGFYAGLCIDASSASTSSQYFSILNTTLNPPSDFYYIPPTCLGELVIK